MEAKMRYEVRMIDEDGFGDELLLATNDAGEAKKAAEDRAHDFYYGTAVLDTELATVDLGDRVVPISDAFTFDEEEL